MEETTEGVAKVIYTAKDGRIRKIFDALDWLAHLVTHIPELNYDDDYSQMPAVDYWLQ